MKLTQIPSNYYCFLKKYFSFGFFFISFDAIGGIWVSFTKKIAYSDFLKRFKNLEAQIQPTGYSLVTLGFDKKTDKDGLYHTCPKFFTRITILQYATNLTKISNVTSLFTCFIYKLFLFVTTLHYAINFRKYLDFT